MDADGDIELVRLVRDRSIERRAEGRLGPAAVVHPDLDERRLHRRVIANGRARFSLVGDRIRDVDTRGMALRARAGPRNAWPRGPEQRRARNDFVPHSQRDVAPVGSTTVKVRAADQIADPDDRADAVVGEQLQVIDQVLARVHLLGHRAFSDVLEPDVPMEIDQRRHHGLAGEVDARGARRRLDVGAAAHICELIVFDDEGGVFDGCAAVAADEARALEDGDGRSRRRLAAGPRRTGRRKRETGGNENCERGLQRSQFAGQHDARRKGST